ncbi:hypothetical protein GCM10017056_32170 [Seohaeicola zhoushanensis]|uniref:Uncharacterized protein n=1 Tax=Seohaeicola zhoushanensis TaxID=1569283 RepID=A0A8J3M8A2_9RHOB|nr:hypothetical protein GCM10017056_32170 [Seohaeicola zhoushanensis]
MSAVQVVTICAPSMLSSGLAHRVTFSPEPTRFAAHFSVAARSMSYSRTASIPQIALKARHWNSDCAPLPIIAIVFASRGARCLAAMAEVAAVRIAVSMVISLSSTG